MTTTTPCPYCRQPIDPKARVCIHCGIDLRTGQYYRTQAPKRRNWWITILAIVGIVALLTCVCLTALFIVTPTRDGRVWPIRTTGPTPVPTITTADGRGDDLVSFRARNTGMAVFDIRHTGDSNFAVWLLEADGSKVDLLVNEIGDYNGRRTARLNPGQYVLEVTADGVWHITMSLP